MSFVTKQKKGDRLYQIQGTVCKFMENIIRRQFTYMVSNFKDNGTIQRRTGAGRPGLSMEIADQVVVNLKTPPSSLHRMHKSRREVECLLGIAQSTVSKLAKLRN